MIKAKSATIKDNLAKYCFMACAVFSILAVATIAIFVIVNAVPAFKEIGFFKFLFGDEWSLSEGKFGVAPMIVGSIYVTGGALLIGVSIGLSSAIFISKFAPKKLKSILKNSINLLAGIPSVVYGFFGMKFIVPMLTNMSGQDGSGMLAASIILGIMILPTIISISVNSLDAVPSNYYEGALALGATKEQAVFKVVVPSAKSGIMASIVLGIGRALGETMAVIMVAGNSPVFPNSLFSSIRTLTGNVVMEMGYAERGSLHLSSIIATGAVLLVFVMLINIFLSLVNSKRKKSGKSIFSKFLPKRVVSPPEFKQENQAVNIVPTKMYSTRKTGALSRVGKWACFAGIALAVSSMLMILLFVCVNGIPNLSLDLFFGDSKGGFSIMPSIVSTLILIAISLAIALPLGIFAAIFLNEYTKPNSRMVRVIRVATETLAGVPSIVFGLFGMLFFRYTLGMGYSLLAGSLTLVLMILPTIIRTCEEALKCIPQSYREASLALGATKIRTLFKVVIPSCIAGIVNAVILSVGRIIGESAALIFTAGSSLAMPGGLMQSGASLSVMLYVLAGEGLHIGDAYATAFVLIVLVMIINALSTLIEKRYKKKVQGNA